MDLLGAFYNDCMMRLTPVLIIITPLLLVVIVLSGFARDIQRAPALIRSPRSLQKLGSDKL